MTQDIWDLSPAKKSLILPQKTVIQAHVEETPLPEEPNEGFYRDEIQVQEIELSVMTDRMNEGNTLANTATLEERENIINSSEILRPKPPVPDFRQDKLIISYSTPISIMFYKNNDQPHCPAMVNALLNGYNTPSSETMDAGKLFETLLLGGGRGGEQTTQLRRKEVSQKAKNDALKKGLPEPKPEMRIDEIRIRLQADRSKVIFFNKKIQILTGLNTQVEVYKRIGNIIVRGTLDLFTPILWENKIFWTIIDTKITMDFTSFGKYCWSDPSNIDITQPVLYWWLCQDIDYSINPMLKAMFPDEQQFPDLMTMFFVANYKCREELLRSEFIPVEITVIRIKELQEVIRKTVATIEMYEKEGFLANPDYNRCKECPLINECQFAIKYQTA
jgi:hypothetical protein